MLGEYVSFSDSILYKLSMLSWQRGNDNFYVEKIPFSFSSGFEYASLCSDLITEFSKFSTKKTRVLECGSGNGVFAKKLIQKLNDVDFEFSYKLTEYSKKLIESYDCWVENLDNVTTDFLDILNIEKLSSFNVAILTYLLDTVPCKCLVYKDSKLYENKVCVRLKNDAKLTNSFDFPFKDFSQPELISFLSGEISFSNLALVSRIQDVLDISWKEVPISVSEFDSADFLQGWLDQCSEKEMYFNYSDYYFTIFDSLIKYSDSSFMFICYDFATDSNSYITHLDKLYGQFGSCYFNNINFSLLKFYCQKNKLCFLSSHYNNSENQLGIITSVLDAEFHNYVTLKLSAEELGVRSYSWVKEIDQINDVATLVAKVGISQQELTQDEFSDYVFRFSIAKKFYSLLSYDNSMVYVDSILEDYKDLALDAIILKSKILRKQYYFKGALELVKSCVDKGTCYELLYLELIFIYAELNKVAEFQLALRSYFKYFTYNPQWQLAEMIN
jgi:hypothetical protein